MRVVSESLAGQLETIFNDGLDEFWITFPESKELVEQMLNKIRALESVAAQLADDRDKACVEMDMLLTVHAETSNQLSRAEEQIERARTYRGIEGYPCPLCRYKDGVFLDYCEPHRQLAVAEEANRMVGLAERDDLKKEVSPCCEYYRTGESIINSFITTESIRAGNDNLYTTRGGKTFVFCPWCGGKLGPIKGEDK